LHCSPWTGTSTRRDTGQTISEKKWFSVAYVTIKGFIPARIEPNAIQQTTGANSMIYEPHDNKTEAANYLEDMKQLKEDQRVEQAEQQRQAWSQRNGNDSGFDAYAQYE
jgi:hypothetical protein